MSEETSVEKLARIIGIIDSNNNMSKKNKKRRLREASYNSIMDAFLRDKANTPLDIRDRATVLPLSVLGTWVRIKSGPWKGTHGTVVSIKPGVVLVRSPICQARAVSPLDCERI